MLDEPGAPDRFLLRAAISLATKGWVLARSTRSGSSSRASAYLLYEPRPVFMTKNWMLLER
jgi:hypothetical protein